MKQDFIEIEKSFIAYCYAMYTINRKLHQAYLSFKRNSSFVDLFKYIDYLDLLKTQMLYITDQFQQNLNRNSHYYANKKAIKQFYRSKCQPHFLALLLKTESYFQTYVITQLENISSFEFELLLVSKGIYDKKVWFLINGPDISTIRKYFRLLKKHKFLKSKSMNKTGRFYNVYLKEIINCYVETVGYLVESNSKRTWDVFTDRILEILKFTTIYINLYNQTFYTEHTEIDILDLNNFDLSDKIIPIKFYDDIAKKNPGRLYNLGKYDKYMSHLFQKDKDLFGWSESEGYYYFNGVDFKQIQTIMTRLMYEMYISTLKTDLILLKNQLKIIQGLINTPGFLPLFNMIQSHKLVNALGNRQKEELRELNNLMIKITNNIIDGGDNDRNE